MMRHKAGNRLIMSLKGNFLGMHNSRRTAALQTYVNIIEYDVLLLLLHKCKK